jgi:N-acetyl-1-D-myo-inositol-2-amino-2-deoxy-alpha-D-glucopyranoside deacetylase
MTAYRSNSFLLVYAHPDDETFGNAGTMAEAVARGVPVTLICATRGEAGDSSIPGLDQPEVLGAVRERELREAMAALGVTDVRLMEYRDSGMPGSPENADPRALINADPEVLADQFVVAIRSIQPATVATFGPDGIYGHGDHLIIHRAMVAAVERAAQPGYRPELGSPWVVPAFYFTATPRDELLALFEQRNNPGNGMPAEMHALMGTPREEITHWLDISRHGPAKHAAYLAHRTQTGDGGPIAGLDQAELDRRLSRETYVQVSGQGGEQDLIERLAAELPWTGRRV